MLADYKRSSNLWSQGWVVSELFDVRSPTPTLVALPIAPYKKSVWGCWAVISLNFNWVAAVHFPLCRYFNQWKACILWLCCPDIWNWCPYCCPVHRQFILLGAKPSFLFQPFWEWMVIGLVNCFKQKPFCTCFVVKESFFIYLFILPLITYI